MTSIVERLRRILDGNSLVAEIARLEAQRKTLVEAAANLWRPANPKLAAQGVPPPPTPTSMHYWRYGV